MQEFYLIVTLARNRTLIIISYFRIWFWVADPAPKSTSSSVFQWPRDSIYGAIALLGGGGAIVNVMSMAMIAHNIGPYAVSVIVEVWTVVV